MYIENKLREPCGISLAGEPIDLSKVKTPIYFISTLEDHIAPWKSTYAGAKLFNGPVRFVLGGSGHIAGIVNPPAGEKSKYWYWTNPEIVDEADEWLNSAEKHPGSWWPDWVEWIAQYGGDKVAARKPGDGKLKVIEEAPGSFAIFRLDSQADSESPEKSKPVETARKPARTPRRKANTKAASKK